MPGQEDSVGIRLVLAVQEPAVARWLTDVFEERGLGVFPASGTAEAVSALGVERFALVLTDYDPDAQGGALVRAARSAAPPVPVCILPPIPKSVLMTRDLDAVDNPFTRPAFDLVGALSRLQRCIHRFASGAEGFREDDAGALAVHGARSLARAVEAKHGFDRRVAERVAAYATIIARSLRGFDLERVRLAAELHHVGMIGVLRETIAKRGALERPEREEVERHPVIAQKVLGPVLDDQEILSGIIWHQERWDGQGYPDGLAGDQIPRLARVIGAAVALEAMTTARSYRDRLDWDAAIEEMRRASGRQFAPEVIEAVERVEPELREAYEELGTAGYAGRSEDHRRAGDDRWIEPNAL